MNRQEARNILYEIHADAFEKDNCWLKEHADSLLKYLDQPLTLAEFLGWEEGVEYESDIDIPFRIRKIKNNELYIKRSGHWDKSNMLLVNSIDKYRNAKKVEKKETKEELLDELQELISSEKIDGIIEKLRSLDNE